MVDYLSRKEHLSFDNALQQINNWVSTSVQLLNKSEDVFLRGIGKLHLDIEGNLQFLPDSSVNYLKTSFGLPVLTVEPVLRGKTIEFTEKFAQETKQQARPRKTWRVAAILLLLTGLLVLTELMWMGVQIKPLNLDEAGVFGFVNHLFPVAEPDIKPLPIEVAAPADNTEATVVDSVQAMPMAEETTAVQLSEPIAQEQVDLPLGNSQAGNVSGLPSYYIIIGAFAEEKNIELAKERLRQRFPDSVILMQKRSRLTLMGYSVGNEYYKAKEQLEAAQSEDSSFWLYKK